MNIVKDKECRFDNPHGTQVEPLLKLFPICKCVNCSPFRSVDHVFAGRTVNGPYP